MLTCEVPPTVGHDRVRGPRHHRHERHRRLPARADQELPGQPAVHPADGAREPDHRRAGASCAASSGSTCSAASRAVPGLTEQVEHTLALVDLTERADTPVSELAYGEKRRLEIGLALATSPSLLLLDEPLAGMSPRERVETVKLLKSISRGRTMIVIDHDMDALFELAERITVLQRRPRAGRRHAGRDQGQRRGAGSLSRRSARRHEPARSQRAEQLLRGLAHPVRRRACASSSNEVVALLGRNGAGKSTT